VLASLQQIDRPLAVLGVIAFISQTGVSVMLPLLPLYAIELGATPRELGLMVSIFAVTQTIGQLSSGVLIGWIPPRRQLPLGQAAYAAANFLITTARSAVPLIAFRALAGFGGGLSMVAERLYVARVSDQARLAFSNGVISAAGSAGSVLGPVIGGVLAVQDLRIPFFVVGTTATIAAVAAIAFLPPEPERANVDVVAESPPRSLATRLREQLALARPLGAIALWNLAFSAAYGGWITTFGPYAHGELGLPVNQVALIFAFFGVGSIFLGPWLGSQADRSGRRRMVAIGSALVLLNVATMIVKAPPAVVFGTAVIAGGGLAAANASWYALLAVATDSGRRGRSFGLVTALSNLGVIAGATLASEVWQRVGIGEALLVAGGFIVLAIASLLFVRVEVRPPMAPLPG
jgi:predicted MFS family arabinose efflux permease